MPRFETTPIGPAPVWSAADTIRSSPAVDASLRPAFIASGPAAEANLSRLFSPGTLCVTTGQQPGLLTGALLTIHKAVSAIALARQAEATLGRPVVPVFWVAGDDHDFAEANHLFLTTAANTVLKVTLRERDAGAPLTPMYREPVGPEITAVFDAVTEHTNESEFRPNVMAWLTRHYQPTQNLAGAYAGAVAELLGPFGLVVFQSTHPAAKRAMAPWLLSALERAADLEQALTVTGQALSGAGRPVPVTVGDGASLVMLEANLGRDRLVRHDGGFVSRRSGERWTMERLRAIAQDTPERFSPNVLLRPVVEAALFPTIAYAAGPGELSYFPQTEPVLQALGVQPQRPVARWSARIIEPRIEKILGKLHITPEALNGPEGQLEASLVEAGMPAEAREALNTLRDALTREYGRVSGAIARLDPTMQKPVESARNISLSGLSDIEKRIVTQLKKLNEIVLTKVARARVELWPLGRPQERVLNVAPYLIRYGEALITEAMEAATAWSSGLEPPTPTS